MTNSSRLCFQPSNAASDAQQPQQQQMLPDLDVFNLAASGGAAAAAKKKDSEMETDQLEENAADNLPLFYRYVS